MPHEIIEATETTQAKAILKHLKDGKTLTPLQALALFGTMRLAARIHDIRNGKGVRQARVKMTLLPLPGGKHVASYFI